MTWTHVKSNSGMGLEEQWILRAKNAPVCSLRRSEDPTGWLASLLNLTGISAVAMYSPATATLEQAQRDCERELRRMGWSLDAGRKSSDATQSD